MREISKAGWMVLGLFLLAAGAAHADEQKICTKVIFNGVSNRWITAGYQVTDLLARVHNCQLTEGNCSACAGAKSYPKNVGIALCLGNLKYSLSPSCQSLLKQGSDNCKPNFFVAELADSCL